MAKTRAQKEKIAQKLTEKFQTAKAVVFTDFKGLTMPQLDELRAKLKELNSEFTITKNTLLKLAVSENEARLGNSAEKNKSTESVMSELSKIFEGPTATLFAYGDQISPIKALVKALKDAGMGKVKMGLLDSELMDESKIQQLASLPSKDELRTKTVGILAAPLQGMIGVLNGNLRNLVYVLNKIQIRQLAEKGGV